MSTPIPKKALGQHWLHDVNALEGIVELAQVDPGDTVVEVGPGLGTLTEYLLSCQANVVAIEFDQELFDYLSKESTNLFSQDAKRLTLIQHDILTFNFSDLPRDYKVVANIPYYLTSNLIRVLSEAPNPPLSVTLLIQKEVAERLCAGAGNMSLLSVWAQMYFECSLGDVVPAALFTPPPKVDSQVVHMKRRTQPLFGSADKKHLHRVIKAGFSNKRKTLHNSLAAGLRMSKSDIEHILTSAGISTKARPQELTIDNWLKLAQQISS